MQTAVTFSSSRALRPASVKAGLLCFLFAAIVTLMATLISHKEPTLAVEMVAEPLAELRW